MKGLRLATYLEQVDEMLDGWEHYNISYIPHTENEQADNLANQVSSDNPEEMETILIETLRS